MVPRHGSGWPVMRPTPAKKLSEFKEFSQRLSWLRSQTGLTQEEFGQRCKVTKSYVSRLESGVRKNPSDDFLGNCCDAFRISLEWLEHGLGQPPVVDPAGWPDVPNPSDRSGAAAVQEFQRDLTGFMRMLLEKAPMTGDMLGQLTGSVSDSPEFGDDFKRRLVLAADTALNERNQDARPGLHQGPPGRTP
jgi:transcriptional regulator with XRE-family HTH domain